MTLYDPYDDSKVAAVIDEVRRVLGGTVTIALNSRLYDLGPNSEQLLRLITALENRFHVSLELIDVFTAESVSDLVELIVAEP